MCTDAEIEESISETQDLKGLTVVLVSVLMGRCTNRGGTRFPWKPSSHLLEKAPVKCHLMMSVLARMMKMVFITNVLICINTIFINMTYIMVYIMICLSWSFTTLRSCRAGQFT